MAKEARKVLTHSDSSFLLVSFGLAIHCRLLHEHQTYVIYTVTAFVKKTHLVRYLTKHDVLTNDVPAVVFQRDLSEVRVLPRISVLKITPFVNS